MADVLFVAAFAPKPPQNIAALGIPQSLLLDIMLRRMLLEGTSTLGRLSRLLKAPVPVLSELFQQMRQQQLVEVKGMVGNDYTFTLSGNGKTLAAERFQITQYAGAVPVALAEYSAAARAQTARPEVTRERLREAYSDLVLRDEFLDQLGPALISQKSIFLYGPTGNGKTSLAERMLRVYSDDVLIPYAVEVDGQIISLYDPVVHQPAGESGDVDARWIRCKRPCVVAGGELVPSMLEVRLDEASGIYAAPLQMKANNGLFIIDDFGRQLISPRDLLNRWIVPLDRRVDYLTLRYGVKFQIPFEVMVVFSTNLDPSDLADEAFLRRIQNKVYVDAIDPETFEEVFRRVTAGRNMQAAADAAAHLRKLCQSYGASELRACYPGDICDIVTAIGRYENRPPLITETELTRAAELYFAKASRYIARGDTSRLFPNLPPSQPAKQASTTPPNNMIA